MQDVTAQQINEIERAGNPHSQVFAQKVMARYRSVSDYKSVYQSLMNLEYTYEEETLKRQTRRVTVRWNQYNGEFQYSTHDSMYKLKKGSSFELVSIDTNQAWTFSVSEIIGELIIFEVKNQTNILDYTRFKMSKLPNLVAKKRMQFALRKLDQIRSQLVKQTLLGLRLFNANVRVRNVAQNIGNNLNQSQTAAFNQAIIKDYVIVQGPPGTGKTTMAAQLARFFCTQAQGKILVCAPTNKAADNIAKKINQLGIDVIRILALSFDIQECHVPQLTIQIKRQNYSISEKNNLMNKYCGDYSDELALDIGIVQQHQVLVTTCVTADSSLMRYIHDIEYCVIDESNQALEPETMIAIIRNMGARFILIGDHMQMSPIVLCPSAIELGYNHSLIERLVAAGSNPVFLDTQYRMHPGINEFPNSVFYQGRLINGVSQSDLECRTLVRCLWDNPDYPLLFWNSDGSEGCSYSGKSKSNLKEVIMVKDLIDFMMSKNINQKRITVLTFYQSQVDEIQAKLGANSKVTVSSIDAFQGNESDFVILSCVRSNMEKKIGFLKDFRRVNVAITRSKYGQVIIGNIQTLSGNNLWNHLIQFYQSKGCAKTGPATGLVQYTGTLPELKPLDVSPRNIFAKQSPDTNNMEDEELIDEDLRPDNQLFSQV